ncbi:hypothetical protein Bpfe_023195 [Biomphalaria pfeifferi]|uniref:Uncharacterized protein n=1 Tax=Biomphalaria pfeifferi TaxID=112525 RepID=A0AAD8F1M9_BIOPF|nr:hypothetical protein Bpfe_023195 [Biomphalaria pfeifferi]
MFLHFISSGLFCIASCVCTQDTRVLLTRESQQGASVPRTRECSLPGSLNRELLYPGHESVAYQGVSTGSFCTQDTRVLLTRESQQGASVPRTQGCCLTGVSTGSAVPRTQECCLPGSLNMELLYPGHESVAYQGVSTGSFCTQDTRVLLTRESQQGASVPRTQGCCLTGVSTGSAVPRTQECCLPGSLNMEHLYPGHESVAYQGVSTGSFCTQDTRVLLTRESQQRASVPRTRECSLPGSLNRELLYPGHESVAYIGVSTENLRLYYSVPRISVLPPCPINL